MKISIRAFARFKDIFGEKNEIEVAEGMFLADILKEFAAGYQDGLEALFLSDGDLLGHIFVMVNRERIQPDEIRTVVVNDGDEIVIYPPVSGG